MCRQMTSQVRWIDTVTGLWQAGARTFVELGPKGVLTKLLAANLKAIDEPYTALAVASPADADALEV